MFSLKLSKFLFNILGVHELGVHEFWKNKSLCSILPVLKFPHWWGWSGWTLANYLGSYAIWMQFDMTANCYYLGTYYTFPY